MKIKKLNKKLVIGKVTVTDLSKLDMHVVVAGGSWPNGTPCGTVAVEPCTFGPPQC